MGLGNFQCHISLADGGQVTTVLAVGADRVVICILIVFWFLLFFHPPN